MGKLFGQTEQTTPTENDFFAGGNETDSTWNISVTNFLAWLQNTALSFLAPGNNLSDLDDIETARENLEVYSEDEVEDLIDAGGTDSGWLDGTVNSTYQDDTIAYIRAKRTGAFVSITGIIFLEDDEVPAGQAIFSLPAGILKPEENILFAATSGGATDESSWLEVSSSALTIISSSNSDGGNKYARGSRQAFALTYPVVTS